MPYGFCVQVAPHVVQTIKVRSGRRLWGNDDMHKAIIPCLLYAVLYDTILYNKAVSICRVHGLFRGSSHAHEGFRLGNSRLENPRPFSSLSREASQRSACVWAPCLISISTSGGADAGRRQRSQIFGRSFVIPKVLQEQCYWLRSGSYRPYKGPSGITLIRPCPIK